MSNEDTVAVLIKVRACDSRLHTTSFILRIIRTSNHVILIHTVVQNKAICSIMELPRTKFSILISVLNYLFSYYAEKGNCHSTDLL